MAKSSDNSLQSHLSKLTMIPLLGLALTACGHSLTSRNLDQPLSEAQIFEASTMEVQTVGTQADDGEQGLEIDRDPAAITPSTPATLEAESMSVKTTGGPTAGGWNIWANGYIENPVSFRSSGTFRIEVTASGQAALGVWPTMEIRINQKVVARNVVRSSGWTKYVASVQVPAGIHKVAIAFINDFASGREDRNLFVDKVSITPPPNPATTYIGVRILNASDGNHVREAMLAAIAEARAKKAAGIRLPPGNFNFAGDLQTADGIHILGSGRDRTRLIKTDNLAFPRAMITVLCSTGKPFRFSGISMKGRGRVQTGENYYGPNPPGVIVDNGIILRGACRDLQIYDSRFSHFTRAGVETIGFGTPAGVPAGIQTGVVYRNEFINNFWHGLGYGVNVGGGGLSTPWPDAVLGNASTLFIENNYFERNRHGVAANYGAKYVARYNRFVNNIWPYTAIDAHGENTIGGQAGRGTRSYEIYENDFYFTGMTGEQLQKNGPTWAIGPRGGAGVIFNNRTHYTYKEILLGFDTKYEAPYPYPYQIHDLYIWNNRRVSDKALWVPYVGYDAASEARFSQYIQRGRDYHLYPKPGYRPYRYPHPLRGQ